MWKIDDFMPIYQRFLESGKVAIEGSNEYVESRMSWLGKILS